MQNKISILDKQILSATIEKEKANNLLQVKIKDIEHIKLQIELEKLKQLNMHNNNNNNKNNNNNILHIYL